MEGLFFSRSRGKHEVAICCYGKKTDSDVTKDMVIRRILVCILTPCYQVEWLRAIFRQARREWPFRMTRLRANL